MFALSVKIFFCSLICTWQCRPSLLSFFFLSSPSCLSVCLVACLSHFSVVFVYPFLHQSVYLSLFMPSLFLSLLIVPFLFSCPMFMIFLSFSGLCLCLFSLSLVFVCAFSLSLVFVYAFLLLCLCFSIFIGSMFVCSLALFVSFYFFNYGFLSVCSFCFSFQMFG